MKDFINNYYNLNIKKLYSNDDKIFFFINNEKIYIIKYKNDEKHLKFLIDITNKLFKDGIKVNTFILNNNNNYYTKKDNDYYIILLKENNVQSSITLKDICQYSNINLQMVLEPINQKWENEVDTLEKELMEYNKEFPKIQESIDYFIGLAENAIELYNSNKEILSKLNTNIAHKLDYKLFKNNQINNPFTFIMENKAYDLSNYIKYKFFINEINYDEINEILVFLKEEERLFLFINLLYPSTYFDLIKRILLKEEEEKKIDIFINNIISYKKLLIYIQSIINNKSVNLIKWISE